LEDIIVEEEEFSIEKEDEAPEEELVDEDDHSTKMTASALALAGLAMVNF
jgi:hypothetical protein